GIYRRRYLSSGAALEAPVMVNTTIAGYQGLPDISMDSAGNSVVVWQGVDADGMGIFAQLYDNSGNAVGSELAINTTTAGNLINATVAMDRNGNFMVTWSSMTQDGDHYGIFSRIYNSSGTAQTGEVQVNTTTAGTQDNSSVSATKNGDYIVAWTSFYQDGDQAGVYAQVISSAGAFMDSETLINTRTTDFQQLPDVAVYDTSYASVIVWQDGLRNSTSTHDGDGYGVYYQAFLVTDITDPVAVCQNITVYLDGTGSTTIAAGDVDGGSTDNIGITSSTISTSSYSCVNIGANVTTLTVFDAAGNSDNCVAAVTVADSTSPNAVCQNINVYLDGTGNASILASDLDGGSSDNCTTISFVASLTAFTCAEVGANTVTLTVTDASGNFSTCNSTVTVIDTISPSASCQNLTVYLDGTGNASINDNDADNGSSDNCSISTYSLTQTAYTCLDLGANTETLTVSDASGNSSSCNSTITVVDTISPSAICQNITVSLDGTGNATITTGDVDGGSTDNCSIASYSIDISSFTCADIGANSVTLTITDGSGNTSACVATVTVADNTSPLTVCQNLTVFLDGTGNATIAAGDVDGGSTDNCSSLTLSVDISAFTCADVGTNNVTLTATDGSGNSSTCLAVVTVVDNIDPTVLCQNFTAYLDGTGNATIGTGNIDAGSTDNCSTVNLSLDITSFTCANIGANTVTLTATDANANTSSCTATVTVADTTSPVVACQNKTVYLDGTGNASITTGDIDAGSTDNCTTVTLGLDITAFTCADVGTNTVTLTATDGSGNTSICTATVTVADTTSPVVACQNLTLYLDGTGNATITTGNVDGGSTDNCSTPTLSVDINAFTCADVGANNVTLTATDGSGNSSTCVAVVTIADTLDPTAVCQNITVNLDGTGNATITTGDIDAGSSDNCSTVTLSLDITSFTCANIGANTVTLTATDASGNTSTCTATVTVADNTNPVVTCQNITVNLDGTGNAAITTGDIDAGSSDNCSTVTLGLDITSFTCADIGANTVTLTATDGSGNSSTCAATV
ncbi:MAG: hypothetical protein JKY54_18210, partial [Flavobacteriales bacterium]|nr:hypothetical protein [Flavobacteriales bacterium]